MRSSNGTPASARSGALTPTLRPQSTASSGAMKLRCWELAHADTRKIPSWEASLRPQRPQTQCGIARESFRPKILQNSRLAQQSGNTLDAAQKVLDTLSEPAVADAMSEELDFTLTTAGGGMSLPSCERDRFYGSFNGTQVEAELRRLGTLVKGLVRDLGSLKESVWQLQDERYNVREKVEQFEQVGLGEMRGNLAKTNSHLKALTGQVEILDAQVVAADDTSTQFSELACRLELLDARVKAWEGADSWRPPAVGSDATGNSKCSPETVSISPLNLRPPLLPDGPPIEGQSWGRHSRQSWGRQSIPDNPWPEGRVPPGRTITLSQASAESSPTNSTANTLVLEAAALQHTSEAMQPVAHEEAAHQSHQHELSAVEPARSSFPKTGLI